ncbi:MAG: hypothetical protein Q8L37_00585 [Candidatus Gottesmanbacteria bacterium]|nr:hypothetical protein [Candidatus Gottesmanbacteria bacterium]
MKKMLLFISVVVVIAFVFFRQWFLYSEIIGGDWPYFSTEFLKSLPLWVSSWGAYQGNGLGGIPIVYSLDSYLYSISSIFVRGMNIPWNIVYKVFYFGLFIVGSLYSAYYLIHVLCLRVKPWQWIIALLIYSTNTYILMVVGGGQLGVALAYAFAPLALGHWIQLIHNVILEKSDFLRKSLGTGISFAVVMLFDARIAYLVAIAVFLYFVVYVIDHVRSTASTSGFKFKPVFKKLTYVFGLPILISLFLHASWILPILVYRTTPLDSLVSNYTSSGAFIFHSFATFSNGISLLHPNWPENIFGKVYFLRPEFLVLPVLAFSSLVWIGQKTVNNKQQVSVLSIRFLSLLALIGAFLAKGANEPFGFVNIWMYEKIPGFALFRDPTKFYLFIILSYAVLIPLAIEHFLLWVSTLLSRGIRSGNGNVKIFIFRHSLYGIFIFFWIILSRQAIFVQLQGTFSERSVPREYIQLKNILSEDTTFSRTLWMPRQPRFAFYSNTHPSTEAIPLFQATNSGELLRHMDQQNLVDLFRSLAVRFVVVPYDPYGEIFTKDRKYDDSQRQAFVSRLDSMPWLTRDSSFQNLAVYEVSDPFGKFQLERDGFMAEESISYKELSQTHYLVNVSVDVPTTLIFSEHYNPYWQATADGKMIVNRSTPFGLNSFQFNQIGTYTVDINFRQQNVYTYGSIVSLVTAFLFGGYFVLLFIQKRRSTTYEK